MREPSPLKIGDRNALAVAVEDDDAPSAIVDALGLTGRRPTVALVGGADGMTDSDVEALRSLLGSSLVPLLERLGGAAVDGGTDAGVMRAAGAAREDRAASFPLVGVVVRQLLQVDDATRADVPPARSHSHFVLVPGIDWGDESEWLSAIAGSLSNGAPSVTVLANGGEVAWRDVEASVATE